VFYWTYAHMCYKVNLEREGRGKMYIKTHKKINGSYVNEQANVLR